jgi:DNA-binding response OmpR family regulator
VAKRVLSISNNPGLLLTRNDMLAVAGYSVSSPRHPEGAGVLFSTETFDAVLIGDSVPSRVRTSIINELRSIRAQTPILYVYANATRAHEPRADECVDVTGDPNALLTALEQHIKRTMRRAA